MINGCLLVNKKIGLTSRQEVNYVSRTLGEKKAGHIGTLDPFADGLLIILLGSSTKISPFLEVMDKSYLATLSLGKKTNTGDLTGEIIEEKKVPNLSKKFIEETLKKFLGEQVQIPPMFSALKVDGKELYKYAREGIEIKRKERHINIFNISLVNFNENEITFLAKVSKGTYIRTLGEDIAEKLGTVGHLSKLTRLTIGPYSLEDSKTTDEINENDLISIDKMLSHYPSFLVTDDLRKKALNGMHFRLPINEKMVILKDEDGIIAMYERLDNGVYSPVRGLR